MALLGLTYIYIHVQILVTVLTLKHFAIVY